MKNKAMEELNLLNMVMMTAIEELERHFESAHHNYVSQTESRTQKFKALSAKDRECAQEIQRKTQRLQRLQEAVNNWKMKISANVRECEDRNRLLREEKESIGKHFQELKNRMNKFRDNEGKFLSDLTSHSHRALANLEEKLKQSERLLKLAELNRKLESEREKILPFEVTDTALANVPKVPKDLTAEAAALSSYAKGKQGQALEEWNMLDEFFKRFNKVLLDKLALDQEHSKLNRENGDLRSILKQYLDGISVTEEGMAQHNSLLVVNNRTNIVHRQPTMMQHVPTQEANIVVRETAKMRQPLSQYG
jgi:chromosome segregation ATPase